MDVGEINGLSLGSGKEDISGLYTEFIVGPLIGVEEYDSQSK